MGWFDILEGAASGVRAGSGAASGVQAGMAGNPVGAIQGASQLAQGISGISDAAGYGAIPGLGLVTGPLSIGLGAYTGNPGSILSGVGSTASAAGTLLGGSGGAAAGTGAAAGAGGAGAAGGGVAAGLSSLGAAIAPIAAAVAIGMMNRQRQEAARIKNQTIESGKIRQGAAAAWPRLQESARGAGLMQQGFGTLDANQQNQALGESLEGYREGLSGHHLIQQLLATQGQGGRVSMTRPVPESELRQASQVYYPALRDSQIGFARAADATAQRGTELPDWATKGFGTFDPAAIVNSMSLGERGADAPTFNAYWDRDYSGSVPGTYGTTIPEMLGHNDPNFASGALNQRFANLPALPGGSPLSSDQIASAASARTQEAQRIQGANQAVLGDFSGQSPWGHGAAQSAMAYSAPYLPGGTQGLWQDLGLSQEEQDLGRAGMTDLPSALARQPGPMSSANSGGGGMAEGGFVGLSRRADGSVPITAHQGESVVNGPATAMFAPQIEAMNAMGRDQLSANPTYYQSRASMGLADTGDVANLLSAIGSIAGARR